MKRQFAFIAVFVAMILVPASAFAQEIDSDIPISFSVGHAVIILLGVSGGGTVAFLGLSKAKKEDGTEFKFDARKFVRPLVVAVLTAIPIAISAAAGFVELNIVTMYLIFAASLGTAELSRRVVA